MSHLAQFVPALNYLSWMGGALLAVTAWVEYRSFYPKLAGQQLFKTGVPTVVPMRKIWLQPSKLINEATVEYQFRALVECPPGNDGPMQFYQVSSAAIPAARKKRFVTTYRVGDYVTALRLPPEQGDGLNLYGFLDLNPSVGVVERGAAEPRSALKMVLGVALLFACLGLSGWTFYANDRFSPLDDLPPGGYRWPLAVGSTRGLAVAFGLVLLSGRAQQSRQQLVDARNAAAAGAGEAVELTIEDINQRKRVTSRRFVVWFLAIVFGPLFGSMASASTFYGINALLDRAPRNVQPVQITDMIATDHRVNFIPLYRHYTIKYRIAGDKPEHSFTSPPERMAQFQEPLGLASIGKGYFGWRWVEDIRPR